MPAVSILMIVENHSAALLERSIESILCQTLQEWEMIIFDESGGAALSTRIIKDNPLIKTTNDICNINKVCSAPLVAMQYANDFSTVTRLQVQKEFMDARPETALCGTGTYVINEEGKLIEEIRYPCNYRAIRSGLEDGTKVLAMGSLMFRKDTAMDAVSFPTEQWARAMIPMRIVENIPDRSLYFSPGIRHA